jgi:hypothetical protein
MSRKIEIVNEKILKGLKAKDGYLKIMQECAKEGEELQKKDDQALQHLSREDEKVRPEILREIKKIELGEFEDVSRVYLGEEDKVFIEIADRLEEWKEGFKKAKQDDGKDNGSNTEQKITNTGDNA